jgi:hypothetical protein
LAIGSVVPAYWRVMVPGAVTTADVAASATEGEDTEPAARDADTTSAATGQKALLREGRRMAGIYVY